MSQRKTSFAPIVQDDTQLLILGSLPGEKSLSAGQYYAHPQNRFWHLMERVIGAPLVSLPYDERTGALLRHKVGLWDAVKSAERSGSLDASIRKVEATDLCDLVSHLPKLRAVAFNGKKSEAIGRPQLAQSGARCVTLPSSSPAHAAMTFDEKAREWDKLQHFLR
ncbi:DNA-deoxyinosine glycosylase [Aurantiacibacter rhizosphaerae]|uniref:DNA-deoxyinosine glycosylase n=1 Tax=Aurantiacibacter rhizosphaerae TaxID=2691582 RepID=A0A844XCD3_9SPHN|nr:DNA-deoxyinosine glycosylase [Aurantiacibacter rhizosphaerae]